MITNRRSVHAALAVTALLTAIACGHGDSELSGTAFAPVTVRTAAVERVSATKAIEVRGVVQPAREAFVSSRVMGPVVAVLVNAGQRVTAGQPLLEIQPEAAEGQLSQAEGALAQAEATLALSERNFRRFEALHREAAASDLELDIARMEYERARGAVDQARGAVRAATSVASESVVRAPFTARVVDTLVEVGDLAAPGRPLVRVESVGGQDIWLTVRASDINRLAVGQRLGVNIDSRPDLGTIAGTVKEILPSADPATHTFTVKASLAAAAVPSGLAGRARLSGEIGDQLLIPASAVHRRGGLELVVVRAPDGTARTRVVTTGKAADHGRVELLSGLDAGEAVAVDIPGPVADGTPLEVAR